MFDRETRRAKAVDCISRPKRESRQTKSAGEVNISKSNDEFWSVVRFKKSVKSTQEATVNSEPLNPIDPIEQAEKDFWRIIEEEKRRQKAKNWSIRSFLCRWKHRFVRVNDDSSAKAFTLINTKTFLSSSFFAAFPNRIFLSVVLTMKRESSNVSSLTGNNCAANNLDDRRILIDRL